MDLIIHILGLRSLLNESHYSLEFLFASGLESRRVMKYEPWVGLEGEFVTYVVEPPLQVSKSVIWSEVSAEITEPSPSRSV